MLTPEETAHFNEALAAALAEHKKLIDAEVAKRLNQAESTIGDQAKKIATLLEHKEVADNKLKVVERRLLLASGPKDDEHRHAMRGLGLLFGTFHKDLAVREKFGKLLEAEYEEIRAMGEETLVAGGQLVPDILAREIIKLQVQYGAFRRNMRVWPLATGGQESVPKLTGALTVYNPAEAGSITVSDLSFGAVAMTAKKWATLCAISSELNEDSVIQLGELIAEQIAYAMAKKEDEVAFNGDASATYWGTLGLLNAAAAGAIATMAGDQWAEITIANLLDPISKIQDYAEADAKWFVNRKPYFQGFVAAALGAGGVTGEEVRQNAFRGARTYMGYPVELTNALLAAATASTKFAVFGDLNKVAKMGQRRGLEIAQSSDVYFATDQIGIRSTQRIDIVVHDVGTGTVAGGYVTLASGAA